MAEAAGWPAELPAAGAHQVEGGLRHGQVRLDRHRGNAASIHIEQRPEVYITRFCEWVRIYTPGKNYSAPYFVFGKILVSSSNVLRITI